MTVAKYVAPNYTDVAQTAAIYKGYIDGGMSVLHAVAGDFAPHAQDTPVMTIAVDAGKIIKGDGTLTEQAAQNTATITAPVTNPRIDRVIIDASTGAVSVITGAEAASPTAPSITAGKLPVAQIALTTSTTAITNSMITDERTTYGSALLGTATFSTAGVMTAGTVPLARLSIKRALVHKTTSQSLNNDSTTVLTFDGEDYDTDSFHDTSTNTDRLTVPAGVSVVRVSARVIFASNATGYRKVNITKNLALDFSGQSEVSLPAVSGATTVLQFISPPIDVSAGDYFKLQAYQNSGGALNVEGSANNALRSWFCIEVIN